MNGVLALSWFEHRRTCELCADLGIELVLLDTTYRARRRYLLLPARTIALLGRRRPGVLLVQSPSLILSVAQRGIRHEPHQPLRVAGPAAYRLSDPYWYFYGGLTVVTARRAVKLAPDAARERAVTLAADLARRSSRARRAGRAPQLGRVPAAVRFSSATPDRS